MSEPVIPNPNACTVDCGNFGELTGLRLQRRRLLDRLGRAVQDDRLDVERLAQCPSIKVILNRYGKFNGAWWDRLADEYLRAAPPLPEPEPNSGECPFCHNTIDLDSARALR